MSWKSITWLDLIVTVSVWLLGSHKLRFSSVHNNCATAYQNTIHPLPAQKSLYMKLKARWSDVNILMKWCWWNISLTDVVLWFTSEQSCGLTSVSNNFARVSLCEKFVIVYVCMCMCVCVTVLCVFVFVCVHCIHSDFSERSKSIWQICRRGRRRCLTSLGPWPWSPELSALDQLMINWMLVTHLVSAIFIL